MPPATDKADPRGQFLNTFMFFTKGNSHLFFIAGSMRHIYTRNNIFSLNNETGYVANVV